MQAIRIGIVAYDGVAAINVASPVEVFGAAARWAGRTSSALTYETIVVSPSGDPITTDSNLRLEVNGRLSAGLLLDTVVIPGGSGIFSDGTVAPIARWLSRESGSVRRVASICTGIFAIAPTGLLDGRRVTTHWAHVRDLSWQYPSLRPEPDAIFLRDDKFSTSAGATAGLDLALALVEEDLGDAAALEVARELLIYRRRDGGQRQYADVPAIAPVKTGILGNLLAWISTHLEDDLSVANLANCVGLSYNELVLRFREAFGTTPAAFVKAMRMDAARRKLLNGETVAAIANRYRFHSKGYFSQEFTWRFGIAPEDYRKRFSSAFSVRGEKVELPRECPPAVAAYRDFAGFSLYGCHTNAGKIKTVA